MPLEGAYIHSRAVKAMLARDDLPIEVSELSGSRVSRCVCVPEGGTDLVTLRVCQSLRMMRPSAEENLRIGRSEGEPVCDGHVSCCLLNGGVEGKDPRGAQAIGRVSYSQFHAS